MILSMLSRKMKVVALSSDAIFDKDTG